MPSPTEELLDLQAALAGEYSLHRELGRGGMGIVYLARDVQLDRDVAIKVLPAALARDPRARERFLREARMAARLSHPHIVPVHSVHEIRGFVFFVMSYIEGETLGERLRTHGPLAPVAAIRVMREVAWALAYAHSRGIVHRDVKPDNILLEGATGRAMVTDFGIAQGAAESSAASAAVTGTAHFMSPEQARGAPTDGRSDLYALGVVGYLAVSGRLPLDEALRPSHGVTQTPDAPPSIAQVAPGLPTSLAAVIDRCVARDPAQRFADGEALAAALAPAVEVRPVLSASLRAWLQASNPLLVPYLAWSGGFGTLTLANLMAWVTGNRPDGPTDIVLLAGIASLPLVPVVGFHVNQAFRQFRAGHTLAELRGALDLAHREAMATESATRTALEPMGHRALRLATVGVGTWLAATVGFLLEGTIHENRGDAVLVIVPALLTMALGALSNALDVQFIPTTLRQWWQRGIRDRLWRSGVGEWVSRRLGAPERSRAVGADAFRATEAALGVAAAELFALLPATYQQQLQELPAVVAALEAQAVQARAELEVVAAIAPAGTGPDVLDARRRAAKGQLAQSVAALESIRLGLLRTHAGASDLAPLTTLMDAARRVGEDVHRLAEAQREVAAMGGDHSALRRMHIAVRCVEPPTRS